MSPLTSSCRHPQERQNIVPMISTEPKRGMPEEVLHRQAGSFLRGGERITEPVIRPGRLRIPRDLLQPAAGRARVGVELGHIWLDVEERGLVEDVHVLHLQGRALHPVSRTTESPIAFGRRGERVARAPGPSSRGRASPSGRSLCIGGTRRSG